jgi:hypothetical protein
MESKRGSDGAGRPTITFVGNQHELYTAMETYFAQGWMICPHSTQVLLSGHRGISVTLYCPPDHRERKLARLVTVYAQKRAA